MQNNRRTILTTATDVIPDFVENQPLFNLRNKWFQYEVRYVYKTFPMKKYFIIGICKPNNGVWPFQKLATPFT